MATIAASLFRLVQGFVGPAEEPGGVVFFADLGDAKARGDGELLAFELDDGGLERLAKPFGSNPRFGDVARRQDDREFLAAVPTGEIHLAGCLDQYLADISQDFVTGLVAVRIVEVLEMID